jgi:hypothetical protein
LTRVVLIAAVALLVTSCSGHGRDVTSVAVVKSVLSGGHLEPQQVRIVTTLQPATQAPLPAVNFCAAEAVEVPSATSLDVDRGRAIVMVFESQEASDDWTPRPECSAKPLRVNNVIAVPTQGRLSPRLRQTLRRLP